MSIYCTRRVFQLLIENCECDFPVEIHEQAVPNHIDNEGPGWEWLPPKREKIGDDEDFRARAVFFIDDKTAKGTERNGQEYVDYLLMVPGDEYETIPFCEVMNRLEEALTGRYKWRDP